MPKFSKSSLNKLNTCNGSIRILLNEAIKHVDFTVTCGLRTLEEQELLYAQGRTMPGNIVTNCDGINKRSNHQSYKSESDAVDIVPYPIDWNDTKRFIHLAGVIRGIATQMGINVVWGGDWDSDYALDDQSFYDYPHFEVKS